MATEGDNEAALALYRATGGRPAEEAVVLFTYELG